MPELRHILEQVWSTSCIVGTSGGNHEGLGRTRYLQPLRLGRLSAFKESLLALYEIHVKSASSLKSPECRLTDIVLDDARDSGDDRTARDSMAFLPLDKAEDEIWPAIHEDNSTSRHSRQATDGDRPSDQRDNSLSIGNHRSSSRREGKNQIFFDVEDNRHIFMEREGSKENAESCSSRRRLPTSKRVLCAELKPGGSTGFKKQRKLNYNSSEPSIRKSSFVNWIPTMSNGQVRLDQATPSAIIPQTCHSTEENLSPIPNDHEKCKELDISRGTVGFQSGFRSPYNPNLSLRNSTSRDLDFQRESNDNMGDMGYPKSCTKFVPGPPNRSPGFLRRGFLDNIWIKRLISKASAPRSNSVQCNQISETSNCNILGPSNICSNKGRSRSRKFHLQPLEGQKDALCGQAHALSTLPIDSHGLRRICDQKLKPELTPCSRNFEELEQVTYAFSKRLEDLKKFKPEVTRHSSNVMCYFCGENGHNLKECSEISETELDVLLENINIYCGSKKSPCLCIHCFQVNHWAISCPLGVGHRIPPKRDVSVEIKSLRNPNVSTGIENFVSPSANNFHLNHLKVDLQESAVKMNLATSGSRELKENQISPFRNFVHSRAYESVRTFEAIKRLRLSRTVVIRCMKHPVSRCNLEGFFLRLRLVQLKESLSRTGYHVAHISGAHRENCLSVCIGGFTYLVDPNDLSNQDFLEEELSAWWSAILNGGVRIPTLEELEKKVKERARLEI